MFESPWHWLIVVVAAAALFGYKKLPDVTRSVARSLRIFKTEMRGLSEDDAARQSRSSQTPSDSPYGPNPYAAQPAPGQVGQALPPAAGSTPTGPELTSTEHPPQSGS